MGGSSFTSDQKTAHVTADGAMVTTSCRVTSIQAKGNNANCAVTLYDNAAAASGTAHTFLFGEEGLQIYIPGSGIRFKNGVYCDLTTTGGVTITYN